MPTDPSKRKRRNEPTIATTELASPARPARAPDLPKGMHPSTRAWWRAWVTSPQASLFTVTDWTRLRLLALLVDQYVREPTPARLAEIRQNEAKYGATPEDRMRLRWRFRDPDDDDLGVAEQGSSSSSPARPKRKAKRGDPRLALVKGGKR